MWFRRLLHNIAVALKSPPYTQGFGTPEYLADHFAKHRTKFTFATITEYAEAADRFCGGWIDKNTLICTRTDGSRMLYNTVTNELGIVFASGVIGTYFRPTRNGLQYFQRKCV